MVRPHTCRAAKRPGGLRLSRARASSGRFSSDRVNSAQSWLVLTRLCAPLLLVVALGGCVSKSKANAQARAAYMAGQQQALARMQQTQTLGQGPCVTVNGEVRNRVVPWTQGLTLAKAVIAAATHAVLSGPAADRLNRSAFKEVIVTNTLPIDPAVNIECLTVLSIAPLIAKAIKEVFTEGSVTSLMNES